MVNLNLNQNEHRDHHSGVAKNHSLQLLPMRNLTKFVNNGNWFETEPFSQLHLIQGAYIVTN